MSSRKLSILHIGDATGVAIRSTGLKKVGLIGTPYTMEDGFMGDWLKELYGIETIAPNSTPARRELHRIILQELSRVSRPQGADASTNDSRPKRSEDSGRPRKVSVFPEGFRPLKRRTTVA